MILLDRFGRPFPEPPRVRRALGFTGTLVPYREDQEIMQDISPYPFNVPHADHSNPVAI